MGARILFQDATFSIPTGAKIGIVGQNGAGKSTLFRVLTGDLTADGGEIERQARAKFVQVQQEIRDPGKKLLEFVLESDEELMQLRRLLEDESSLSDEQLADVYGRLGQIDGFAAEARAAQLLGGLGFSTADFSRPLSDFSGGWQIRAALVSTLFAPSDCPLLDEPTNHLDLETAVWLENYLDRLGKTLLIISHEKDFLNRICDHILFFHGGTISLFSGNYDTFRETFENQKQAALKFQETQAKKREHLETFVRRFRAKATKAKQVQSRLKMLAKMEAVPEESRDYRVSFCFPAPSPEIDRRHVTLDQVDLGYGEKVVLRGVDFSVDEHQRIGLLGRNGNGKSTLIRALAGKLSPVRGTVKWARQLKVGYFSQQLADELDLQLTPLQTFALRFDGLTDLERRSHLARFGLNQARADTRAEFLSGGEKTRLLLALISFQRPHLLLLDEPTNHLDIESRGALIDALARYGGAVVMVSHDFYTLEKICRDFYLIDRQQIARFDGGLETYRKWILASPDAEDAAVNGGADALCKLNQNKDKKSKKNCKNKVGDIEAEIANLTQKKTELEERLATQFSEELYQNLTAIEAQLADQEQLWIHEMEQLEDRL